MSIITRPRLFQMILPLLILLLGAGLRIHGLARDVRLHPDEALYNTYARDAAIKGDWLFTRPLDKPPLLLYANALSMTFIGVHVTDKNVLDFPSVRVGEFAGRLPNTLVSILTLALVYALTKRLYRDARLASLAMLLMALSPFAIAFSPTAFTDIFMVFWMLMALWLAVRHRWGWAGFALALGLASKQPAPFYLPLILVVGAIRESPRRNGLIRLLRFTATFTLGVILLLLWDAARGQLSIWQVSAGRENYPMGLVALDDILPRLAIWLSDARWLISAGWITAGLFILACIATAARFRKTLRDRAAWMDAILLVYVLGYGLLHWLVAFNTFDRYLLPLVPLLVILAARGIIWLLDICRRGTVCRALTRWQSVMLLGVGVLIFIPPAIDASAGRINVGGDLGQHAGIDRLAEFLNSQPVATVIYDHWLGWELAYYMGPWNDKRRVYYPTPELLIRDALALSETGLRYFPVPKDAPYAPWIDALEAAGFNPEVVYTSERFIVFALTPP